MELDLECSNAMKGMCVQDTWAKVLAREALFNLEQTPPPPPPPTPLFEPLPPFFLKVDSPTVFAILRFYKLRNLRRYSPSRHLSSLKLPLQRALSLSPYLGSQKAEAWLYNYTKLVGYSAGLAPLAQRGSKNWGLPLPKKGTDLREKA